MPTRLITCTALLVAASGAAANPAPPAKHNTGANDKVCENITATGSRLATKRFCGTKAEWEDRKQQDKDAINKMQSRLNGPCSTVAQHSGTPSC